MAGTAKTTAETNGRSVTSTGGVLLAVYLLALMVFSFYTLVALWPGVCVSDSETAGSAVDMAEADDAVDMAEADDAVGYLFWTLTPEGELPLVFLVFAAGILGGLIHAIRSFYWYIGHRMLYSRWVPMYLLLPVVSGALASVFYLVIRGGLYHSSSMEELNALGFVALGGLVGLFSEQAILKLKTIAESFFEAGGKGDDDVDKELEDKATEKKEREEQQEQEEEKRAADTMQQDGQTQ